MTEKQITVDELCVALTLLSQKGYGDHIVELSVNYDNCDHIQSLGSIYAPKDDKINWITLRGIKKIKDETLRQENEYLKQEIKSARLLVKQHRRMVDFLEAEGYDLKELLME